MQNITDFYNTRNTRIDYSNWCVDNGFLQTLQNTFYKPCLVTNKIPQFVFDDAANKIGIVAPKRKFNSAVLSSGINSAELYNPARNTSVVNLFGYNGYFNNNISFLQEVAEAQWYLEGNKTAYKSENALNKLLFTDYMLRAAICYVEVFRGDTVTKFYATRNVELLAQLSLTNCPETDAAGNVCGAGTPYLPLDKSLATTSAKKAYETYLALSNEHIRSRKLPYLKLNAPNKKTGTYSIVMPRGALANLETSMQYRITPVFGLKLLARRLELLTQKHLLKLTFVKDNLQLREFYTTTNYQLLLKYGQDADKARDIIKSCSIVGDRGYIRLPDITLLGTGNCMRAVDMRLTQITVVNPATFVNNYADIDLQKVPEVLRWYINSNISDRTVLERIYVVKELLDRTTQLKQYKEAYVYYMQKAKVAHDEQQNAELVQQWTALAKQAETEYSTVCNTTATSIHNNFADRTADVMAAELLDWLDYSVNTFSTTFLVRLHDMMLGDKKTFPDYATRIKSPIESTLKTNNKVMLTHSISGMTSLGDA